MTVANEEDAATPAPYIRLRQELDRLDEQIRVGEAIARLAMLRAYGGGSGLDVDAKWLAKLGVHK